MAEERWFSGVADVPENLWTDAGEIPIDRSRKFRQFRDIVEGGETFVAAVGGSPDPVLACGYVSSPGTGVFSDPWKLWCDDQFLRLDGLDEATAREIVGQRDDLLRRLVGATAVDAPPTADLLHESLGGCFVVRGLDSTEVFHPSGKTATTESAGLALSAIQAQAANLQLGVAFPYVDRGDSGLVHALRSTGFVLGAVTATNIFDLPVRETFDDLLARAPGRVRYRFRKEWKDFHASGYTLHELDLEAEVREVVDLETRNRVKHGGKVNLDHLMELRRVMARLFRGSLRAKGVRDASGELVACGIDIADKGRYLGMVYGQDEDKVNEFVYPTLAYSWPLRYAVEHRIPIVRMGFEAFRPKTLRGSRVEKRVFAFWHPDGAVRNAAGELLTLIDERLTRGVIEGTRTTESADEHWSFTEAGPDLRRVE